MPARRPTRSLGSTRPRLNLDAALEADVIVSPEVAVANEVTHTPGTDFQDEGEVRLAVSPGTKAVAHGAPPFFGGPPRREDLESKATASTPFVSTYDPLRGRRG
jgi:hypothetical protein